ncbi:hypothetical protein KIPB_007026, partial [Kipferlia bialata]
AGYGGAFDLVYSDDSRTTEVTLDNIIAGVDVVRGEQWNYKDQDGGKGTHGTILRRDVEPGWVIVKWKNPAGTVNRYQVGDKHRVIQYAEPQMCRPLSRCTSVGAAMYQGMLKELQNTLMEINLLHKSIATLKAEAQNRPEVSAVPDASTAALGVSTAGGKVKPYPGCIFPYGQPVSFPPTLSARVTRTKKALGRKDAKRGHVYGWVAGFSGKDKAVVMWDGDAQAEHILCSSLEYAQNFHSSFARGTAIPAHTLGPLYASAYPSDASAFSAVDAQYGQGLIGRMVVPGPSEQWKSVQPEVKAQMCGRIMGVDTQGKKITVQWLPADKKAVLDGVVVGRQFAYKAGCDGVFDLSLS